MKVLLAHPGTQHAPRLAGQLHRLRLLQAYWSGVALSAEGPAARLLRRVPSARVRRVIESRAVPGVPGALIHNLAAVEMGALLRVRLGGEVRRCLADRNEAFQARIPEAALEAADVIVGFDTSSRLLMERAHRLEKKFILDRTTAFDLTPVESAGASLPGEEVLRGQRQEVGQAERVVVASSHARAVLVKGGVSGEKIRVIPYGVDLEQFRGQGNRRERNTVPRFLFVGSLGMHKGVDVLLEAWGTLPPGRAELWLAGPAGPDYRLPAVLPVGTRVLGAVPRSGVARLMRECDVFVLPSRQEGFGLVILEAMASGLPVITTTHTAGPDLIEPGREGWLVEPGDVGGLADALRFCIENPEVAGACGRHARERAEEFSWDRYGDRWRDLLLEKE